MSLLGTAAFVLIFVSWKKNRGSICYRVPPQALFLRYYSIFYNSLATELLTYM